MAMQFLSCDWGTSNFRLRWVDSKTLKIIKEVVLPEGIASTHSKWEKSLLPESERISFYKQTLKKAIACLGPLGKSQLPIILSGMASSSLGLMELPYLEFPFTLEAQDLRFALIEADEDLEYPIFLISGACTEDDIMRGEEVILLGCMYPEKEDGIYIFPGTHSKHVIVQNSKGIGFKTYITGEIFHLLVEKSIIGNSVEPGEDRAAFVLGVEESEREDLLHSIFTIRAKDILQGTDPVKNYQYLSGLLIGAELRKLDFPNLPIHIVSENPLLSLYAAALAEIDGNRKVKLHSSNQALLKGHLEFLKTLSLVPIS
jgi:2-dehydro-3-deoxygalactonokinase